MIYQHIYTRCNKGYYSRTDGYDTAAKSDGLPDSIARGTRARAMFTFPELTSSGGASPQIVSYTDFSDFLAYCAACEPTEKYGMNIGREIYFYHQYIDMDGKGFGFDDPESFLLGADFLSNYDETAKGGVLCEYDKLPLTDYQPLQQNILSELRLDKASFISFAKTVLATISESGTAMLILLDKHPAECSQTAKRIMAVIELLLPPSLRRGATFCTFWTDLGALSKYKFVFSSHESFRQIRIPVNVKVFNFTKPPRDVSGTIGHPYAEILWRCIEDKEKLKDTVSVMDNPLLSKNVGSSKSMLDTESCVRLGLPNDETMESYAKLTDYISACLSNKELFIPKDINLYLAAFCRGCGKYSDHAYPKKLLDFLRACNDSDRELLLKEAVREWAAALDRSEGGEIAKELKRQGLIEQATNILAANFPPQYAAYAAMRFNGCSSRSEYTELLKKYVLLGGQIDEPMRAVLQSSAIRSVKAAGGGMIGVIKGVLSFAKEVNIKTQEAYGQDIIDREQFFYSELENIDFIRTQKWERDEYIAIAAEIYGNRPLPDRINVMQVLNALGSGGSYSEAHKAIRVITCADIKRKLNDKIASVLNNYSYPSDFSAAGQTFCCALLLRCSDEDYMPSYEKCIEYITKAKKSIFPFAAGIILNEGFSTSLKLELTEYLCGMAGEKKKRRLLNDRNWRRMSRLITGKCRLFRWLSKKRLTNFNERVKNSDDMRRIDAAVRRAKTKKGNGSRARSKNRKLS